MPTDHLKLTLSAPEKLALGLTAPEKLTLGLTAPSTGTRDYEKLINRPQINGVTLSGNQTLADLGFISENTEAGWQSLVTYVPKPGEICLFTDTGQIKIGDGAVPIVDLPFLGDTDVNTLKQALEEHMRDETAHITQAEREKWNNKLNYAIEAETLVLNRL